MKQKDKKGTKRSKFNHQSSEGQLQNVEKNEKPWQESEQVLSLVQVRGKKVLIAGQCCDIFSLLLMLAVFTLFFYSLFPGRSTPVKEA